MRHRLIALPFALLATLAIASVALAGGWAQVTVKDVPTDPPAGGQTVLNLDVLQHGVTPVSWPHITVIATDAASGAVVSANAQAKGPEGSYVATIVFPSAGEWTLTFASPELDMSGSVARLNVAPAVAAALTAVTTPAASTFEVMPLLLMLIAAALAITVGGLFLRNGRAAGAKGVTVRT